MISLGELGRDATFLRRSKLDRARISLPFAKIGILVVENALSLFQKTRVQTDSPRFYSHLFGICRGRVHIGVLSIRLGLQSFCRPLRPGKKHAVTLNTVCFYLPPSCIFIQNILAPVHCESAKQNPVDPTDLRTLRQPRQRYKEDGTPHR